MNMNHKQLFILFLSSFAAVIPAGGYSLTKKTDQSNPIQFGDDTAATISFKYCGKNPAGQQIYLVATQEYLFEANDNGGLSNICNGDLSGNLAKNKNIQVVKVENGLATLVSNDPPASVPEWLNNIDTKKGDITYDQCDQHFDINGNLPISTDKSTCKNGGGTPTPLTNYMMCNWRWQNTTKWHTDFYPAGPIGSVKKGCPDYIGS